MPLSIVGLGICLDLTENALEEIKNADEVWIEAYTTRYSERILNNVKNKIKSIAKKEAKIVDRELMESNMPLSIAKTKNLVICCFGDPLFATTHISLIAEAEKQRIKWKVIQNAGILNAVLKIGLSPYKFGQVLTISKWYENYKPLSWAEKLVVNLNNGMHTICLIDPEIKSANELYEIIKHADSRYGFSKVIKIIFYIKNAGCENESIGTISMHDIKNFDMIDNLTLIIPSKMNENEIYFTSILAKGGNKKLEK
ncbi:MAG: diphthine synthase [Candidatus Anstonellales archaeon]